MISIHHGGQFTQRVKSIQKDLLSFKEPLLISDSIVILPTNRWKRRFIESLINLSPNQSIAIPHIYSYNEFIELLHEKMNYLDSAYEAKPFISTFFKESLFAELLSSLKGSFQYYTVLNEENAVRGIIKRLLHQIDELIQAGFSAESFIERSAELNHPRIKDISLVFKAFESEVLTRYSDINYFHIDLFKYFSDQQFKDVFKSISKIYFLGFDLYSHIMSNFIEQLSGFVNHLEVHINGHLEHSELTAHTKDSLNFLLSTNPKLLFYNFAKDEFFLDFKNQKKDVVIKSFPSFEDEIRHIFSKISDLYQKGIPLHEMIIAFPNLDLVRQNLRDLSDEFALPLNLSSGYPLIETGVIQFIQTIFQFYTKNEHYLDIVRFFESSCHSFSGKINLEILMKAVAQSRKEFGFKNIINAIKSTQNESDQRTFLCSELENLEKLLKEHFSEVRSASELSKVLYSFFEKIGFFDELVGKGTDYEKIDISLYEPDVRAFYSFSELLKSVSNSYDLSHHNQFDFKEFKNLLFQEIQDTDFQLQEIKNVAVSVMPLLELRSEKPKVLFLAGMNQSVFPKTIVNKSLFNEYDRNILKLSSNQFPIEEERYLLYLALNQSGTKTYISDHSEGSETDQQSNLILDLNPFIKRKEWTQDKLLSSKLELLASNDAEDKADDYNFIANEEMKTLIQNQFQEHSFSASQLQRYLDCPYQYLMKDVLKLRRIDELSEDLSSLELGSFMHRIMYRLYAENENFFDFPISSKYQIIKKIVEEELGELNPKESLYLDKFEISQQVDLFKKIIDVDQSHFETYKPSYFEWRFGKKTADSVEDKNSSDDFLIIPHSKGKLKISGKIDRIDVNENGEAILIDYKSSKDAIQTGKVKSLNSIQIPLYILAVDNLIQKTDAVAGMLFSIGKKKYIIKKTILADKNAGFTGHSTSLKNTDEEAITFDAFLDLFKNKITEIHQSIMDASFELNPLDKSPKLTSCTYCDYSMLCRIKEKLELDNS